MTEREQVDGKEGKVESGNGKSGDKSLGISKQKEMRRESSHVHICIPILSMVVVVKGFYLTAQKATLE